MQFLSTVDMAEADWLERSLQELDETGFVTVKNVLPRDFVDEAGDAAIRFRARLAEEIGEDRLGAAARAGANELRMPFVLEPFFFRFLEVEPLLAIIDATLGESAVLRFQNLLSSREVSAQGVQPVTSQFHQNFKFHLANGDGLPLLCELGFVLGDQPMFFEGVPRSERLTQRPDDAFLKQHAVRIAWEPGDMFAFNPFVWHRELPASGDRPTLAVFQQFSRPFIKPHADYCRAIDRDVLSGLAPRTQRLLGWHARLPASMNDFYLPEDERPYRAGQW